MQTFNVPFLSINLKNVYRIHDSNPNFFVTNSHLFLKNVYFYCIFSCTYRIISQMKYQLRKGLFLLECVELWGQILTYLFSHQVIYQYMRTLKRCQNCMFNTHDNYLISAYLSGRVWFLWILNLQFQQENGLFLHALW